MHRDDMFDMFRHADGRVNLRRVPAALLLSGKLHWERRTIIFLLYSF